MNDIEGRKAIQQANARCKEMRRQRRRLLDLPYIGFSRTMIKTRLYRILSHAACHPCFLSFRCGMQQRRAPVSARELQLRFQINNFWSG